jgi:hypothetical protein
MGLWTWTDSLVDLGTWIIRSVHRKVSLKTVTTELEKFNLSVLALQMSDGTRVKLEQETDLHFHMGRILNIISFTIIFMMIISRRMRWT